MVPPTTRKLFPIPKLDPCSVSCSASRNPYRICPSLCVPICPTFCHYFLLPPHPPPPPPIFHHTGQNNLLAPVIISMFVLLASAFTVAISYLLYSLFKGTDPRRRQPGGAGNLDPELDPSYDVVNVHPAWYIATIGLQRSAIESIAVCKYRAGEGLVLGTGCAICLAEYRDGDALRLLPKCCHSFHVPCIDTWLSSHTTCPTCRAPIVQPSNNSLRPEEVRVVEIGGGPSSSREVIDVQNENDDGEVEREAGPIRRGASMDRLCAELGEKMASSSSIESDSMVERSQSFSGKLSVSTQNGVP